MDIYEHFQQQSTQANLQKSKCLKLKASAKQILLELIIVTINQYILGSALTIEIRLC